MKKIAARVGFCAIVVACPVGAETVVDADAVQAQGIVKEFSTTLKGELLGAIKEGGPVHAIAVCRDRAPAIARSLSETTGWQVGRTSLKLRNPALNTPDEWEKQMLVQLEERNAAGEDVATMSYGAVVETADGPRYRFVKAIPVGAVCLVCHGEQINPDLAAAIDEAYPDDEARGFRLGELRGAFTLAKPR